MTPKILILAADQQTVRLAEPIGVVEGYRWVRRPIELPVSPAGRRSRYPAWRMQPSLATGATILGKYRIEEVLGRGGMGVVVRAKHLELGEVVAIKILSEELPSTHEFFARFMREARAAAKLRTEHVTKVFDVGVLEGDLPYMVMELLEGVDLHQMIKQGGSVDPRLAVTVAFQTCEALAEAHALGIVHRDIKPSNLFVIPDRDGGPFVKLLDFGIAKAPVEQTEVQITRTYSVLGTPSHMSPEQLRSSRTVDGRTDLWALGVVLYEALEGRRPFDGRTLPELTLQIALMPVPPMTRTAPDLAAVVMRCLEKEPDARYQNASELAAALAPFVDDPKRARSDLEVIERLVRDASQRLPELTPVSISQPLSPIVAPIVAPRPVSIVAEPLSTKEGRPGRLQEPTAPLSAQPLPVHEEPPPIAVEPRVNRRALAIAGGLCAIAVAALVIVRLTQTPDRVSSPPVDAAPIALPVVEQPKREDPPPPPTTKTTATSIAEPVETKQPAAKKRTKPAIATEPTKPAAETVKPEEDKPPPPPPAKDKPSDWMVPQ